MGTYFERIFWDRYAYSYDNLAKHFRPYQDLVAEVCDHVDRIADKRSLRILDAGCGTGNYSWELARRGHRVIGIDNSPVMLTQARSKHQNVHFSPQFLRHNLSQTLPFSSATFDMVISTMVLYALPEPETLVREIRRVVVDKGNVILVTMRDHAHLLGSIREAGYGSSPLQKVYMIGALAEVGILNILINMRHSMGSYHLFEPSDLASLLDSCGWMTKEAYVTYVCDTGTLATAVAK